LDSPYINWQNNAIYWALAIVIYIPSVIIALLLIWTATSGSTLAMGISLLVVFGLLLLVPPLNALVRKIATSRDNERIKAEFKKTHGYLKVYK
jgi:hypothetical protein